MAAGDNARKGKAQQETLWAIGRAMVATAVNSEKRKCGNITEWEW